MSVVAWDVAATLDKMEAAAAQVAENFPWVDMLVYPELVASGVAQFVPGNSPEPWREVAAPVPGEITERLCGLAARIHKWIIPGSMYEVDDDRIYNTSIAISPEGRIVAKYRKMFPWLPYEAESTPGNDFCVFDVPGTGRFGLCICYDGWFPEVARSLAWLGAEVIVQPSLTATSDRTIELVLGQANAVFNQCYLVGVNAVGPWGGGRSLIIDPEGRVLQQAGESEMIMTEIIDLDQVKKTREMGTLGLCRVWTQLRGFRGRFPPYGADMASGPIFKDLG